jgi:hypothetical protein
MGLTVSNGGIKYLTLLLSGEQAGIIQKDSLVNSVYSTCCSQCSIIDYMSLEHFRNNQFVAGRLAGKPVYTGKPRHLI